MVAQAGHIVAWVAIPRGRVVWWSYMKVLFVITKSNYGGAQRYVYDLATAMARTGDDVAVAFGGTGKRGAKTGTLEAKLEEAGIRTIRVRHFMRDVSFVGDLRALGELIRIIRTERPEVLHVTSSKAGGLGALAGRILRVPRIIFTSHGLVYDESWRPLWQRALLWVFTWCTMLCAHDTIQISRATYERARRMPFLERRIHLIYNGIPEPMFEERVLARRELGTAQTIRGVWVGTIAELHPNKNLMLLVDACAALIRTVPDVHLWLIGNGEARGALIARAHELRIEERVHFPGYIENAARLLPALDVFVLPSAKEGLPYVLLEAGYAGLPVVASDINGNNDIVEHGVSGLLVPQNVRSLTDALMMLVNDVPLRTSYGAALRLRVRSTFSCARMVADTLALYASSNPTISRSRSSR